MTSILRGKAALGGMKGIYPKSMKSSYLATHVHRRLNQDYGMRYSNNANKISIAPHHYRCFSTGSSNDSDKKEEAIITQKKKLSIFDRIFGIESNDASEGFTNRWLMTLPAFATHLCIGSPWAWSLMADVLTREHGFVAPSAMDWSLGEAALPLSIIFVLQGLSASLVGKWQMNVGPRKAMAAASVAFGGGLMIGAAGIHYHMLPLLYLGYGVMGGTGIGLAYTPPVQTLIQWFPDKKGIASGLTIAGFGSGALIFTPAVQYLMTKFAVMPQYLGPSCDFKTKFVDGRMCVDYEGKVLEVVQAGAAELAKIPYSLQEGLYVVGTGSTGAAEALAAMGLAYFGVMMTSALVMKRPHSSYANKFALASTSSGAAPAAAVPDVGLDQAMKAPQFYLLGATFFCLASGGMSLMSVAKPMMSEVFSKAMPVVVTSAFASQFVLMLAAGNLGGRLGWAALSDSIGRRKTFYMFTATSVPLYLALPTIVDTVLTTQSTLPLYVFCGSTALAISMMGGVFAILPAYEADLFGSKFVGPIHGRMLLFSSGAAIAGPQILLNLRGISERKFIAELLEKVSPQSFEAVFGAPVERANELLASKSLTISKLLALCPPGTPDPTPHLYDTTMYTLTGLMATAFVCHSLVRPMNTNANSGVTVEGKLSDKKE